MAKAIKRYRVRYSFMGEGSIIVCGTSKDDAQKNAGEVLRDIVPILRPQSAKTYTNPDIIPNDSEEDHSRDIESVWHDERGKHWKNESLFGDTPTKLYI